MPELDAEGRDALGHDQFAYVDRRGGEHLPIDDADHVRNAIARFDQTEFESVGAKERARKRILAAARGFHIAVGEDSIVRRPVTSLQGHPHG
jgi:hypothetical protein